MHFGCKKFAIKKTLKLKINGNYNTFDDDTVCNIFDLKWNKNSQNEKFNDEFNENDSEIFQRLQLINKLKSFLTNFKRKHCVLYSRLHNNKYCIKYTLQFL